MSREEDVCFFETCTLSPGHVNEVIACRVSGSRPASFKIPVSSYQPGQNTFDSLQNLYNRLNFSNLFRHNIRFSIKNRYIKRKTNRQELTVNVYGNMDLCSYRWCTCSSTARVTRLTAGQSVYEPGDSRCSLIITPNEPQLISPCAGPVRMTAMNDGIHQRVSAMLPAINRTASAKFCCFLISAITRCLTS